MMPIVEKLLIAIAGITLIFFCLSTFGCEDKYSKEKTKVVSDDIVRLSYVVDGKVISKFKSDKDVGIVIANHDGKKVILHDQKYYDSFNVGDSIYFEAPIKRPRKEEE